MRKERGKEYEKKGGEGGGGGREQADCRGWDEQKTADSHLPTGVALCS